MTPEEIADIREKSDKEWSYVSRDEGLLSAWETYWYAGCLPKAEEKLDEGEFSGLWGLSRNRDEVLPPACVSAMGVFKASSRDEARDVWRADALTIREAPPRRSEADMTLTPQVDGCWSSKNVCGKHGCDAVRRRHNMPRWKPRPLTL